MMNKVTHFYSYERTQEEALLEIKELIKGLEISKKSIGWGSLLKPYAKEYKGKYGEGYAVHIDPFRSKDGKFYHNVIYYTKSN